MIVKPFGWRRNLDYIKTNIVIMIKTITEYKINLFNIVLAFGFVLIINTSIAYILSKNVSDTINWQFQDFLLLSIFSGIIWGIYGMFHWNNGLKFNLVSGRLNSLLVRPIKIPIKFYFRSFSAGGFAFFIMSLFYGIFINFYFKIVYTNYFYGICVFLLILAFFMLFSFAIDSFNLLYLGLGNQINIPFKDANNNLTAFPAQFFGNSKIKYILNFIPMYFVTSMLIPIITDKEIVDINYQANLLIIMIILSLIVLIVNWEVGLKKYEAFG